MFKSLSKSLTVVAFSVASALAINGCTNATSHAGRVSYYTEGVIMDIEKISLNLDAYSDTKNTALGAAVGAGVGNLIGKDSKGTLIGAGIGALLGGVSSNMANRTEDGARLTIRTDRGMVVVDQPFSCDYRLGARVRMLNQGRNQVQLMVDVGGTYRSVGLNNHSDCKVR